MNIVMRIVRWILVLPASLAALVIVFAGAKIFDYISGVLANFYFGPVGDTSGTIICGLIAGGAFVFAGVETAPAGKKYVAIALPCLPTIYSLVQVSLYVINFFHHIGKIEFSTVLENISLAGGAVIAARELYKSRGASSSPTPIAALPEERVP